MGKILVLKKKRGKIRIAILLIWFFHIPTDFASRNCLLVSVWIEDNCWKNESAKGDLLGDEPEWSCPRLSTSEHLNGIITCPCFLEIFPSNSRFFRCCCGVDMQFESGLTRLSLVSLISVSLSDSQSSTVRLFSELRKENQLTWLENSKK